MHIPSSSITALAGSSPAASPRFSGKIETTRSIPEASRSQNEAPPRKSIGQTLKSWVGFLPKAKWGKVAKAMGAGTKRYLDPRHWGVFRGLGSDVVLGTGIGVAFAVGSPLAIFTVPPAIMTMVTIGYTFEMMRSSLGELHQQYVTRQLQRAQADQPAG